MNIYFRDHYFCYLLYKFYTLCKILKRINYWNFVYIDIVVPSILYGKIDFVSTILLISVLWCFLLTDKNVNYLNWPFWYQTRSYFCWNWYAYKFITFWYCSHRPFWSHHHFLNLNAHHNKMYVISRTLHIITWNSVPWALPVPSTQIGRCRLHECC